jgi:hypothetical protein
MTLDRHAMANAHEDWLARALNGRRTKGSGNQWRDQLDGRLHRLRDDFAWAWDAKSTMGKSMSISKETLAKLVEQAGGERPMLPIRFYETERLRKFQDWLLVRADDFLELNSAAHPTPYDTWTRSCGCECHS